MKQLILVHGINQQNRSRNDLERLWTQTLRNALGPSADSWWASVAVHTAYYGDVLHAAEQSWSDSSLVAAPMSASSAREDYAPDDVAALYIEVQNKLNISDEQVRQYLDEDDDGEFATPMGRGVHKKWLKAITRTLEGIVPGIAPGVARSFLPQAAAYLHKPNLFEEINSLVREQVFDPIDDFSNAVVVGHSLGSVVSYVLLRSAVQANDVPLFLTLGSPLGIEIVKKRIGPPYVKPPGVVRWINGSDQEDFVALHPELTSRTFGPAEIENITDIDNGYDNPHDIEKYLSQPSISDILGRSLIPE